MADGPGLTILDFSADYFDRHEEDMLRIAGDVEGEYWSAENFRRELPGKWQLSFVLSEAGSPVAYAISSLKAPDHVHLHHFMVRADMRGRACGQQMLDELDRRALGAGAARLTLKVVADSPAEQFYRRHGFALLETGETYNLYGKNL